MKGLNHGRHGTHGTLLLDEETYQIRGAVFAVRREMGAGFLEAVYQECFALEMRSRNIPSIASPPLALAYKGQPLKQTYVPDFVVFGSVIVELKAMRELAPEHRAQVLNYLKATGLRVGLLVNFGSPRAVQVERLAL